MAKSKKQSEPITPKEIIANEPEIQETIASLESKELDKAMEVPAAVTDERDLETALADGMVQIARKYDAPISAEQSVQEILVKAGIEPTEEEKILSFLDGKTGFVRLNEVLKSLYGVPRLNEPARFLWQPESKRLKALLQRLVDEGKITVRDNGHLQLGKFYYDSDNRQKHRNLNDTVIEAATKNS